MGLKPFSGMVWELITRWEHAEPPRHRTPIPEPIMKAIVSLAWSRGFHAFAGVTLLAFHGLGRIGEVLRTSRQNLLLPRDDLWNSSGAAFLRLSTSKTATRGKPRVQHLKISSPMAVALIERIFARSSSNLPRRTGTGGTRYWPPKILAPQTAAPDAWRASGWWGCGQLQKAGFTWWRFSFG